MAKVFVVPKVFVTLLLRKTGLFLTLIGLCTFATVCVADSPPAALWQGGNNIPSGTPAEACLRAFNSYKVAGGQPVDSYTVVDTTSPTLKICRLWIGTALQSAVELGVGCFFNGVSAGVGIGNPHSFWSNPRIEIVSGSPACVCPPATPQYDGTYGVCTAAVSNVVINLTGPTEARPAGTDGISTASLVA